MHVNRFEDSSTRYTHVIRVTKTLNNNIIWCIDDIKNIKVDIKDEYDYNLYLRYLDSKNIKDYITEQGPFKGIEHDVTKFPSAVALLLNQLIEKYEIKLKHCENLVKLKCGDQIIDPKKFTNMCYNMFELYTNKIKELEQKINLIESQIIDDNYVQNFDLSE